MGLITRAFIAIIILGILTGTPVTRARAEEPSAPEAAVIAGCQGRAWRHGDTLFLKADERTAELTSIGEKIGNVWEIYKLIECNDQLGLFIVRVYHWEWAELYLVSQKTGWGELVAGPVHPSPSGRTLAVVEHEHGITGSPNGVQILFRKDDGTWSLAWDHRPVGYSPSKFVGWNDDEHLRIKMMKFEGNGRVLGAYSTLRVSPTSLTREDEPPSVLCDGGGCKYDSTPGWSIDDMPG